MFPRDPQAVALFTERYGALPSDGRLSTFVELLQRFSLLPYENLSKILAWEGGRRPPQLRLPRRVMEDHLLLGTGGTCFSLTELLRQLVETAGVTCHPVMAHMRHGANIHCALRVELGGQAYLVDPGYLVREPLLLGATRGSPEPRPDAHAVLVPAGSLEGAPAGLPAGDFDLYTHEPEGLKWRYRFADRAPSPDEFLRHWQRSFYQPGMRSLLVTQRNGEGEQLYLHDHKLRRRGACGKQTTNIREHLEHSVETLFGIDRRIAAAAWQLLAELREERRAAHGR